MAASINLHPVAVAGFGAGNAEGYDKVRLSYPPEALSYIRKHVDARDNLNIVDVGCGTGIFTRALLASPEWQTSFAAVRCIDPSKAMRAVFSSTVNNPRVTVADGTFENTGVPDRWADVIVAATAFHWCMDLEAAMKEIERVLKPGGIFCVTFSNDNYYSGPAWLKQAFETCVPYQDGTPTGNSRDMFIRWKSIQDLPLYKENFCKPEEAIFRFTTDVTANTVIERFLSWSALAMLPSEEKMKVAGQLRPIIDRGDELVWKDESKGIIEVPAAALVHVMKKHAI